MKDTILSQYEASLKMLKDCIEGYDEDIWYDSKKYHNAAWHLAYHAIFYANIYAASSEKDIKPWSHERQHYNELGDKLDYPPFTEIVIDKTYTRAEILDYLDFVRKNLPGYLESFKPDEKCWPHWYKLNQLEFHINNLRHIQHHTAQLMERHNVKKSLHIHWASFE
jgi:hypothetical protein